MNLEGCGGVRKGGEVGRLRGECREEKGKGEEDGDCV